MHDTNKREWFMLGALVAAAFAFRNWVATVNGRLQWDQFKLKIPIAGKIVLKATLARFARSFSLAVRSGVPAVQALVMVAHTVDNEYIAGRIDGIACAVDAQCASDRCDARGFCVTHECDTDADCAGDGVCLHICEETSCALPAGAASGCGGTLDEDFGFNGGCPMQRTCADGLTCSVADGTSLRCG